MSKHAAVSQLSSVQRSFILHWGEMGTRWGINRTVAQVHALLYISPQPLNADHIVEALEVARSNVSTSLKELQGWGIVRLVHVQGDKRDHFESLKDVWEMFRIVMDERKKREFDPTMHMLRACIAEAERTRRPTNTPRSVSRSSTRSSRRQRRSTGSSAAGRRRRFSSSSKRATRCSRHWGSERDGGTRSFSISTTRVGSAATLRGLERMLARSGLALVSLQTEGAARRLGVRDT